MITTHTAAIVTKRPSGAYNRRDPRGRFIVSDEYGKLYRVTAPPLGTSEGTKVENIDVDIGEAQGLLWAFDSLYVVVNRHRGKAESGLWRVRSSRGDDVLDTKEKLHGIDGNGEYRSTGHASAKSIGDASCDAA